MHFTSPATHETVAQPHPLPRLDIKQHLLLSVFWFSLTFQSAALLPLIIPLQVVLILAPGTVGNAQQAVILGWIAGVGSAIALVVMPLTGMLSDYTHSRFGRRRPYILFGTLVMVAATLALGYVREAIGFLVALGIMQLASVVTNAAYQGLIPDLVPDSQRGAASGFMGLMTILGNVGSLAIAGLLLIQVDTQVAPGPAFHGIQLFYLLASIILFAGMFVTVVGIREAHEPHVHTRTPGKWYQRWAMLWLVPLRQHNFVWVFITRAFVMLGLTLFMTFIEYYFADVAHTANFVQATAAVALLALVGAVGSAIVLGFISDRVGRVPVVFFASSGVVEPGRDHSSYRRATVGQRRHRGGGQCLFGHRLSCRLRPGDAVFDPRRSLHLVRPRMINSIGERISVDLRQDVFHHLESLPRYDTRGRQSNYG